MYNVQFPTIRVLSFSDLSQNFTYHFPAPFTLSVVDLRGEGWLDQNFLRGRVGLTIFGPE